MVQCSRFNVLLVFFLLNLSSTAFAWGGFTHGVIAKEGLREVAQEWGLNQSIPVTPFQKFLEKFSRLFPEVKTRDDFAKWLKINPNAPFDRPSKKERERTTTTPLEILTHYSKRADDGRDKNLSYDSSEQFWYGSGTETATQAFRHMEKPAFNPLHPLNTFGFPLGRLGQATERAQIYFDLAVTAHRLGEPYWAWNFLGVSLHYLQDMGQPYHSAQLLPPFFTKGTGAYWRWGWKQQWGWIRTVTHVVSNLHHFFEGYVNYFLIEEKEMGKLWLKKLRGKETLRPPSSIVSLAKQIRDDSNRHAFESVRATLWLTSESLLTERSYIIDSENNWQPEDPKPFLTDEAKKRLRGASQLSQIVLDQFEREGKVMRTVVQEFLKATQGG